MCGAWAQCRSCLVSVVERLCLRTLSQSAPGPSVLSRTAALTGLRSGADAEGAPPQGLGSQ